MLSKARLITWWEGAISSYWLIPTIMGGGAVLLSLLTVYLDTRLPDRFTDGRFFTTSATGARSLLATIAGSLISVAGVVFSITIVALTLASNQFGPRILRNFMRDKGNQFVLGTFVASFVFCLLILRQVHGGEGDTQVFVPQVSVLIAVVLALASIGVLIYFIHHISISIQATNLLARIAKELMVTVDRLFPDQAFPGEQSPGPKLETSQIPECDWAAVRAETGGYLQRVDHHGLLQVATERDFLAKVVRRAGHFLVSGDVVVYVHPATKLDDRVQELLRSLFSVDVQRGFSDDPELGLNQLVEVGVRALSPGTNDPFTAMECADWLAEVLSHWTRRQPPRTSLWDANGRLRVIAYAEEFADTIDQAFNQLRQNSARQLAVMIRLLESIGRIANHVSTPSDRRCLAEHAKMLYDQARQAAGFRDLRKLEARYAEVCSVLDQFDPSQGSSAAVNRRAMLS